MSKVQINELAAILVQEHGHAALGHAEHRRAQHAHQPGSESFRMWASIARATARLLHREARKTRPALI